MDAADGLDLALQGGDEAVGQDGDAVVFALAVADNDLMAAKVYVFDAQAKALYQAQARAIEELRYEFGDAVMLPMTARASSWVRAVGRSISLWRVSRRGRARR